MATRNAKVKYSSELRGSAVNQHVTPSRGIARELKGIVIIIVALRLMPSGSEPR
jgi:hypothetical protein